MKKIKEYPETHLQGRISIENIPSDRLFEGDLGIQIAQDGRVWVCINGSAFLRFHPIKGMDVHGKNNKKRKS